MLQPPEKKKKKGGGGTRDQWFVPIILATQEAEIRRITVQIVHETLSRKKPSQKRAGRVALSSNPRTKNGEMLPRV
jgi:hypothetical protein